ncbi:MAG: GerMN domain-containing protein [Candidatus Riflebacteria bacterium]|nr:GerMN domain-containing protein [Candidatus Riflebacteria bacterium]
MPLTLFFRVMLPVFLFFAALVGGLWLLSTGSPHRDQGRPLLSTEGQVSRASPVPSPVPIGDSIGSRTESKQAILYLGARETPTKLVPYPFTVEGNQGVKDLVDRVITALQGPFSDPKVLPTVPKGTRLLSMFQVRKRLIVNLSREFSQLHVGGTQSTILTLCSLANTLIDLGLGDEVQLLIQGREESAYLDHLDLSRPLTFRASVLMGRGTQSEFLDGARTEQSPRPSRSPRPAPSAAPGRPRKTAPVKPAPSRTAPPRPTKPPQPDPDAEEQD